MTANRRLAAILAADVAGYSRLMGADEEGTLERLKALRRELVDPKIAEHKGRIVKTTGDALLVEFASVVDAVRCAVEVQQAMPERNTDATADSRIELRIGINLGDVIVEGEDLYGDGVNIAARLEALADAGGVFVSNTVHDHVRDRLPFVFEDLGEQQVKNITRPVRVYRVRGEASKSIFLAPALPLPDKPSIAVLPFQKCAPRAYTKVNVLSAIVSIRLSSLPNRENAFKLCSSTDRNTFDLSDEGMLNFLRSKPHSVPSMTSMDAKTSSCFAKYHSVSGLKTTHIVYSLC
jgi:class 3 adenylate cyclase